MEKPEPINIYECFDQNGDPSHYVCFGHVDSERFREQCFKEYSVRPLIIQHQWQHTRKVISRESGRKRVRSLFHSFRSTKNGRDAKAITIGLAPNRSDEKPISDLEIN